jgi:ketosteroid isomerase-like protein
MHPHAELIQTFYEAFQRRDAEAMGACYHPDVAFSDPVFPALSGDRARGMWAMLCKRGKDLTLEFSDVQADDSSGSAHWEARYTFSATGNMVHNVIDAEFTFADGLIKTHTDTFDLWRWAGQALGFKGKLLGWAPFVQNAVRAQADKGLSQFMSR